MPSQTQKGGKGGGKGGSNNNSGGNKGGSKGNDNKSGGKKGEILINFCKWKTQKKGQNIQIDFHLLVNFTFSIHFVSIF